MANKFDSDELELVGRYLERVIFFIMKAYGLKIKVPPHDLVALILQNLYLPRNYRKEV